jgi:hypothetical protein
MRAEENAMEKNRFPFGLALSFLLTVLVLGVFLPAANAADDDDQFIPTGVHITPSAAPGAIFQSLNPGLSFDPAFTAGQAVTTALSPDGRTHTTVSCISTMVDILGIEHLGLTDYAAPPMADIFKATPSDWTFHVTLPSILVNAAGGDYVAAQQSFDPSFQATNATPENSLAARYSRSLHDGAWWVQQTKGMDFSREDRVDANRYNRLLWTGYPWGPRANTPPSRALSQHECCRRN